MMAAIARAMTKVPRSSLAAAAISVLAGTTLCYLGVRQTVAAFLELRGSAVLDMRDGDGAVTSSQDAKTAISQFEHADLWWREPSNSFGEGLLLMRIAVPATGGQYDRDLLRAARGRFERSLAEGPADARAWAALANARLLDEGPSSAAVEALALSMASARYEPSLLAWRCQMGLAMYQLLDAARKAELDEQIRMLERHSGADLVKVARSSGRMGVVITALATDNAVLQRFEDSLRYVK